MAFVSLLKVFIKCIICTKFLKCFILKISLCAIMSGFRKSGHILPKFKLRWIDHRTEVVAKY